MQSQTWIFVVLRNSTSSPASLACVAAGRTPTSRCRCACRCPDRSSEPARAAASRPPQKSLWLSEGSRSFHTFAMPYSQCDIGSGFVRVKKKKFQNWSSSSLPRSAQWASCRVAVFVVDSLFRSCSGVSLSTSHQRSLSGHDPPAWAPGVRPRGVGCRRISRFEDRRQATARWRRHSLSAGINGHRPGTSALWTLRLKHFGANNSSGGSDGDVSEPSECARSDTCADCVRRISGNSPATWRFTGGVRRR